MPTLMIIDMQDYFNSACHEPTIQACIREVTEFYKKGFDIVLVEYIGWDGMRPTINRIVDPISNYHRVFTVVKSDDDGSKEIIQNHKVHNWDNKEIHICGVNADCCVAYTIRSLKKAWLSTKFTAVLDAINSLGNSDKYTLTSVEKLNIDIKRAA